MLSSGFACPRTETTHHRLYEFVKTALIKIFVNPYATVCELYCGGGADFQKWAEAQIGHYIGIDTSSSGISEFRQVWESQRNAYTADFFELDPSLESTELHLQNRDIEADVVFCMQHLQLCFETEERARMLLNNVSSLLRPGGYFLGITPDSSTIWAKYQKNVEAYHNKSSSMKPSTFPNCIRSESYLITFEVEEEKFPTFGKKYQLKISSDISAETYSLVHFPSLIRLAREAGLEYVEIQNLTEFYDDNRAQFAGMMSNYGANLVDPRGRLLPRSYDMLGLYTTFIFQKPDPDIVPPIMSPIFPDETHSYDEREWQHSSWREDSSRDDEKNGHAERPPIPAKIAEQKGILGPGPADLRFSEAL